MYSVIDKVALNSAPVNAPVNPDTVFCFCLCVATEKSPQPFTHSGPIHSRPLSSSCAFQGLKRGLGRVRAVGQCVFLTHRFQELTEHVQPLQNPPRERETIAASCFPASAHVATRPRTKLLDGTMCAGVIQLSTGLLLGISPALLNSVVWTTIECCSYQSRHLAH